MCTYSAEDLLGAAVRFDRPEFANGFGAKDLHVEVTGVVVYVNKAHQWFSIAYGNPAQRTSFKFFDIGKSVHIVNKRKRRDADAKTLAE